MKCFNHNDRDAVAICKGCYKALCPDCSSETSGAVSCKGGCQDEVAKLQALTRRAYMTHAKTSKAYRRQAWVHMLVGLAFALGGIVTELIFLRVFLLALAGIFFLGTGFYYRSSKEFRPD